MLITKNENEPITILEISRVYRDDDGKILLEDSFEWNYNDGALIDLSSITNKEWRKQNLYFSPYYYQEKTQFAILICLM